MTRLPRLTPAQMTAEQQALYDRIVGGPRGSGTQHFALTDDDGSLNGPFNALLLSPSVGSALQELGAAVRYRCRLSDRVREITILMVAAHWASTFELATHESIALSVGLTDDEIAALRSGSLEPADPDEAAAVSVVRALLERADLDDEGYAEAVDRLGERAVFELTTVVGYYATIALQLRVFRVD